MKAIASKLVKVMAACDYVQKDGRNDFHRYKYASAANVLEKVNAACVKHNVASVVANRIISDKEKTTSKGGTEYLITVETTLTLIDGDSGESLTVVSLGTGQDAGDKAIAKAQTMALKYAWMTTLNISTGDDPEADEDVDRRNHPEQAERPRTTTEKPRTSQNKPETQQRPAPLQSPPKSSNTEPEGNMTAFWASVGAMGFTEADVHAEEGVDSIKGYSQRQLNALMQKMARRKQTA